MLTGTMLVWRIRCRQAAQPFAVKFRPQRQGGRARVRRLLPGGPRDHEAPLFDDLHVLHHAALREDDPAGLAGEEGFHDQPVAVRIPGRHHAHRVEKGVESALE